MPTVQIACPHCSQTLVSGSGFSVGVRVQCPRRKAAFTVEAADLRAAALASTATAPPRPARARAPAPPAPAPLRAWVLPAAAAAVGLLLLLVAGVVVLSPPGPSGPPPLVLLAPPDVKPAAVDQDPVPLAGQEVGRGGMTLPLVAPSWRGNLD